jgi:outer membrane protein OmpA-like peptidoglycan-associated protein
MGCPALDTDGDGILDKDDKCPHVKGEPRFGGCPDTDGDGIADEFDKCPDVKGARAYQGCPQVVEANADSDNDGIPDFKDACPDEPGVPENKGCPEMSEEDKAAILAAFENLLFESGKDVIQTSSHESLKELAAVLVKNAGANLRLEGHTDNVGDDDANLDLSDRRTKAVKLFLVNQGVKRSRISATGFGETRPVTTNDTADGRKQNRRVEMKIDY